MNPAAATMIDLLADGVGDALLRDSWARGPLLALDFDGTLAPLVDDPGRAAIHPRVEGLLRLLIERMPVAIVSGRGLADLRARISLPGATLVGNHGNEWDPGPEGRADAGEGAERFLRQQRICREWALALAEPLAAFGSGIAFESKAVSLSVHYRLVPDPGVARRRLLSLFESLDPAPGLLEGKFVFNLMPPGLVTKYEAVAELVAKHRSGTAIFVGDDVTDEHVFERAPGHWLTVRVWDDEVGRGGVGGSRPQEGPVRAPSRARSGVDRVEGVLALLERLEALSRAPATRNL